jgi:uncharacterized protein with von Willebrand factor type A (vWA) domain
MGDAYAKATGELTLVSVHSGPGLTNALTGIGEAAKSRTPLVVLAGDVPNGAVKNNFYIEQGEMVRAVGAVSERLHTPGSARDDALRAVTRALRERDPDDALSACSASVPDWSGGTRIASSLRTFNKLWARRVLGQGAIVLLITDGLERDADDTLAFDIDRLHRSCRRLIWLNPLLRFEGFEARARGIKTMLPHVDEFRPIHNLESMASLVAALQRGGDRSGDPKAWMEKVA